MSSEQDSSDSRESCSDDNNFKNQFSAPCCSKCDRKEESKSYCVACECYLCQRCDFSHRIIHFNHHRIVSLVDVENVEHLERILHAECEIDSENGKNETTIKQLLEMQFWEGTRYVNTLLRILYDLRRTMEGLGRNRAETLGYLNELHLRFQEYLKHQKDQIVVMIDEEYTFKQKFIASQQEAYESYINNLLIRLSDLKLALGTGENASGFDFIKMLTDGNINNLWQPLGPLPGQQDCDFLSSFPFLVQNSTTELALGTTSPTGNTNFFPYDSFNLPLVASEPSNSMCDVNPALSLPVTNPDSLPVASNINTIQIYKTFGQKGNSSSQFNSPHGFCVGLDEDIIVADSSNHRVQIFDKFGCFKSQFGVAGRHDGYLWHPRKVALLSKQRRYVVCDRGYERSRMQIFTESGKYVKKIYIQYIDIVAGIAVTDEEDIVVVNSVTPTVFIIGQNDFLRSIDCTSFMQEPSDITVVGKEFYICDFKAHSVVVIDQDGNLLRKFGNKNSTVFPNGIAVSPKNYVFVGDSHGNFFHIVVFKKDGTFIAEYRCPYIKVSRCCGLKITKDGRVITVDKNYHHVIILETPSILE